MTGNTIVVNQFFCKLCDFRSSSASDLAKWAAMDHAKETGHEVRTWEALTAFEQKWYEEHGSIHSGYLCCCGHMSDFHADDSPGMFYCGECRDMCELQECECEDVRRGTQHLYLER